MGQLPRLVERAVRGHGLPVEIGAQRVQRRRARRARSCTRGSSRTVIGCVLVTPSTFSRTVYGPAAPTARCSSDTCGPGTAPVASSSPAGIRSAGETGSNFKSQLKRCMPAVVDDDLRRGPVERQAAVRGRRRLLAHLVVRGHVLAGIRIEAPVRCSSTCGRPCPRASRISSFTGRWRPAPGSSRSARRAAGSRRPEAPAATASDRWCRSGRELPSPA